uniref:Uncharacterized protein n=1 Tax=Brassica campestris TaxID=3711 RepID=A0A3P5ZUD8_BRACM|nr:unnamed protein product [Brassica rapa]
MTTTTTTADNNGGKTQTQTHKKQVRRRLHTSRPYQERLLNMAEARREIVTALKQHRASMRQAAKIPPPPPPHIPFFFTAASGSIFLGRVLISTSSSPINH